MTAKADCGYLHKAEILPVGQWTFLGQLENKFAVRELALAIDAHI